MVEGEFPYTFPFTFANYLNRFIKFTDIDDSLAFDTTADSLMFGDIKDTIKFTEVME